MNPNEELQARAETYIQNLKEKINGYEAHRQERETEAGHDVDRLAAWERELARLKGEEWEGELAYLKGMQRARVYQHKLRLTKLHRARAKSAYLSTLHATLIAEHLGAEPPTYMLADVSVPGVVTLTKIEEDPHGN